MKKRIILLALITVCIMAVTAGCGKKKETADNETASDNFVLTDNNSKEPSEPDTKDDATDETTASQTTEAVPTEPEIVPTEPETAAPVGVWTMINQAALKPSYSGNEELDGLVKNVITQVTNDGMSTYQKIWAVYEYLIDNITYSRGFTDNTGAYSKSDPAKTATEILWATDLLNSGQGCCYNYSSACVYLFRAVGLDAKLVSGNVPKYGGGTTPHCWLEVTLEGQKYTFDPDLDMNYFTRGENESKSRWFGQKWESVSYFYRPETYHNN